MSRIFKLSGTSRLRLNFQILDAQAVRDGRRRSSSKSRTSRAAPAGCRIALLRVGGVPGVLDDVLPLPLVGRLRPLVGREHAVVLVVEVEGVAASRDLVALANHHPLRVLQGAELGDLGRLDAFGAFEAALAWLDHAVVVGLGVRAVPRLVDADHLELAALDLHAVAHARHQLVEVRDDGLVQLSHFKVMNRVVHNEHRDQEQAPDREGGSPAAI